MRLNNLRILFFGAVLAGIGAFAEPVRAEDSTPAAHEPSVQQWQKDQDLEKATWADIKTGGVLAVAPHVSDLESALTNAKQSMASAKAPDGTAYVFTDGLADSLIAMVAVASDKSSSVKRVASVQSPYPSIALCLGSYYDEVGKYDDAVRVLDEGLDGTSVQIGGLNIGDHAPLLLSEKGAALNQLKRWNDAIAVFDTGIGLDGIEDGDKARLYRGKGYALTELGRLDDADSAYNESLKLDPGNENAEHELRYIAHLREGEKPTQGYLAPSKTESAPTAPQGPSSAPAPSSDATPPTAQPAASSPH